MTIMVDGVKLSDKRIEKVAKKKTAKKKGREIMSKNKLETSEKLTFILEDKRKKEPSSHQKVIVRETDNPVIFDNGYKVSSNQMEIDEVLIANAMRYISKMTAGIATGVLSDDKEYVKLQRKFVDMIIRDKVKEVKGEVEEALTKKKKKYSNIPDLHQKALDDMRKSVAKVTEEHGIHIFINNKGECVAVNTPEDIEYVNGSWTKVTIKELKNIRDAKEKKLKKKTTTKKKAEKRSDR